MAPKFGCTGGLVIGLGPLVTEPKASNLGPLVTEPIASNKGTGDSSAFAEGLLVANPILEPANDGPCETREGGFVTFPSASAAGDGLSTSAIMLWEGGITT